MIRRILAGALLVGAVAFVAAAADESAAGENKVHKSDAEWQRTLTPEQYQVMRCSATEPPFTGKYWNHHAEGVYTCAGCGADLFASRSKYDSGSGWPSYFAPVDDDAVGQKKDLSLGMMRIEIVCDNCGAHLGHVFEDGPRPTGLRYCVNSASLLFVSDEELADREPAADDQDNHEGE